MLGRQPATIVGIDHGFSFPIAYFKRHKLPLDWQIFLDDFCSHWPADEDGTTLDSIRRGEKGRGLERLGDARWRRLTEARAGGAKSVFHFDVPGSVAKSTHAGLPWLRVLRGALSLSLHFWPFDGWRVPRGASAVLEVFPTLWRSGFPRQDRTPDQHDAYCVAAWLQRTDAAGALAAYLEPELTIEERRTASIEGWILGVM